MRLLSVIHYPVFSGPHNQVLQLAEPLTKRGIQTVSLLPREAGNAGQRLRAGGVEVITIPLHRLRATPNPLIQLEFLSGFPREVQSIRRIIRERNIDVVQIGGLVNPHAAIAARLEGVPVVWQILDTRAPRPVAAAAMVFVSTLATVVMSTGLKVAMMHPGGSSIRQRLVPFFPPVSTDRFRPRPALRSSVRADWRVPDDAMVIGSVANINPQKGIETLLRAYALVRQRLPPSRLVLVGAEHDTHRAYSRHLRSMMVKLGLADGQDVIFLGDRQDVDRQMQGFDLFALASVPRSEGIPTVIIEAMASGLPVVATDVGGVSEIVEDGVTGAVVPPLDPVAFAQAVLKLLHNSATVAEMGATARARAEERLSIESCLECHLRAYRMASEQKRADIPGP